MTLWKKLSIAGFSLLFAALPAYSADVSVTLSDHLNGLLGRMNDIEQTREESFRNYRSENLNTGKYRDKISRSEYKDTPWAGEALIPNLADYSVEALAVEMLQAGLRTVNPADLPEGDIRLHIERIKIPGYSLNKISSSGQPYMSGNIDIVDASGAVVSSQKVLVNYRQLYTQALAYSGPDHVFLNGSQYQRVGPLLAQFVRAALGKVMDNSKVPNSVLLITH
jgi:hypothetical protein